MQKAVVGLFFKNTDFKIIPKAMNQWKEWVKSSTYHLFQEMEI